MNENFHDLRYCEDFALLRRNNSCLATKNNTAPEHPINIVIGVITKITIRPNACVEDIETPVKYGFHMTYSMLNVVCHPPTNPHISTNANEYKDLIRLRRNRKLDKNKTYSTMQNIEYCAATKTTLNIGDGIVDLAFVASE